MSRRYDQNDDYFGLPHPWGKVPPLAPTVMMRLTACLKNCAVLLLLFTICVKPLSLHQSADLASCAACDLTRTGAQMSFKHVLAVGGSHYSRCWRKLRRSVLFQQGQGCW